MAKPELFSNAGTPHIYAGPSSSALPYYLPANPFVNVTSIVTTGDAAPDLDGTGSYRFGGIPDGIGAYDNPDGTFTVLVNHELRATLGVEREHGAKGAYVSKLIIDEKTLQVVGGEDLIETVHLWNGTQYVEGQVAFDRFCSGDLADKSAFYNAATGKGYDGLIYLNGEESANGRAFAHVATGAHEGHSYELPFLGNLAFENVVAHAGTGDLTLVAALDDSSPKGQVYFYVGEKQATGDVVQKAGLSGGDLYGVKVVAPNADESEATGFGADVRDFALVKVGVDGDVSSWDAAQLNTQSEALGVTEFLRPEDGAWDTVDNSRFYFVTTDKFDGHSRLWRLDFDDVENPTAGGEIELMADGGPYQMFDNITVNSKGQVLLQEDPGNQAYSAKIWLYDPGRDSISLLAESDPKLFGSDTLGLSPSAPFTQDEESSGIIDVSHILGNGAKDVYLFDVQAHYANPDPELVEGGQLLTLELNNQAGGSSNWDWIAV